MKNFQKNLFVVFIKSAVKCFIQSFNDRLLLIFDGHSYFSQIVDKKFHGPQPEIILLPLHKLN